MARRGTPYQGVLYAGLMIKDGQPRLVEYNVRFGDPECQVLMMRLGAQAMDLMHATAEGGWPRPAGQLGRRPRA
jgi:phosphoribosylamine--glycine ligase